MSWTREDVINKYRHTLKEISDIEFKLEIRDSDYNEIDNPTIQVTTK